MLLNKSILDFFDPQVLELCLSEIKEGYKLGVAVSGGADSVFVLLAFVDIFKAENLQVLHFNHKLRANADIEEHFVCDLCEKLGVECLVGTPAKSIEKHSEEAFRLERLKFFKEGAFAKNLRVIAQGHHIGDVAETMLMRLMRGASLEGLVAPRHISRLDNISFVRAFLRIKKSRIIEELTKAGFTWKEDESNATNDYLRNKLRNKVIPEIREICDRDFDEMALLTKTLLLEQQEFFEDYVSELYSKAQGSSIKLSYKHRAISRALLSKFLYERHITLSLKSLNGLLDNIEKNQVTKLSTKDGFLEFANGELRYEQKELDFEDFCVPLQLGENTLPDGSILKLEKIFLGDDAISFVRENSKLDTCVYMDFASVKFPLYARNRRQGDSIKYLGLKSAKKVQDIFVDEKVDRKIRSRIALVSDNNGDLLWVPYAPPSKKVLVKANSDVLLLTFVLK